MTDPRTGLSIVDQYAARRQRAKESWSWHLLFAMGPFCLFIWGPRWLAIPAWVSAAVIGGIGVRRQFQINRCPACNRCRVPYNFVGRQYRPDPYDCDSCGVNLVPRGE